MSVVKKYPVVGGPLDGEFANNADWYKGYNLSNEPTGRFADHVEDYVAFNAGERGAIVSRIWLHVSLLKPSCKLPQ